MAIIDYIYQNWISFIFDIFIGIISGLITGLFQKNSTTQVQHYTFQQQVFHIKEILYHKQPASNKNRKRKSNKSENDLGIYLFLIIMITLVFLRYKLQIYHFFLGSVIISSSAVLTYSFYLAKQRMLKGLNLYYCVTLIFILTFSYLMLWDLDSFDIKPTGFSQLIQDIGFNGLAILMTKVMGYLMGIVEILIIPIIVLHIWLSHSRFLTNRFLKYIFRKTAFVTTKYKLFIPYLIILCLTSWFFSSGNYGEVFNQFIVKMGSIIVGENR